jgi:hypothetical protein
MPRLQTFMMLLALLPAALSVSGGTTVVEHYDACMAEGGSFQAVAACGKARQLAACSGTLAGCSATRTAIMQYADTLSAQVANREITDAEAMRRFIEFKTTQLNVQRHLEATAAASGPTTCNKIGNSMICN